MNFLRKQYHKYQYRKLLKQKNTDFLKFKKDYEHSPLDEFYNKGERVFSRKELEYWKLIDIKNQNKLSPELLQFKKYNADYEKSITEKPGKVIIGSIIIKEKNKTYELPLAVDKRTNELFFDIKKDGKKNDKLNREIFNWKPYQSKYVNFMIYGKISKNKDKNEMLSFKNVSITSKNESYKDILENIKNNIGKGVNQINNLHNQQIAKNTLIEKELKALRKENKILVEDKKTEKSKDIPLENKPVFEGL